MTVSATTYGPLKCHEVEPTGETTESVVVLCHGYGAPGTDLVPLARELRAIDPRSSPGVRFVFPQAPLTLESLGLPDGRAWWHLDVAAINESIARGELRDLRGDFPEGAVAAREQLLETIAAVAEQVQLPLSRFVLGGFSQGAMVAADVALRLDECPAGLCVFSGTLVAAEEWSQLAAERGPMPVVQSHGRFDPILPYDGAIWLRDAFQDAGLSVDFLEFDGVHTIPYEALERLAALVAGVE